MGHGLQVCVPSALTCLKVQPYVSCLRYVVYMPPICWVVRCALASLELLLNPHPCVIAQVPLAEEGRQEVMQQYQRQEKHLCLQPSWNSVISILLSAQCSLWLRFALIMGVQYCNGLQT